MGLKKLSVILIYRFIDCTTIGHKHFYEWNHSLKMNFPFLKIGALTISTIKNLTVKRSQIA